MYRIDTPGNNDGNFVEEDIATSTAGTALAADWLNSRQAEMEAVIEAQGMAVQTAETDTRNQLNTAIDDKISKAMPAGSIITMTASNVPTGFVECDGALLDRTLYATLFAIIGTIYNVGDGSTTFGIPDLRGESIRGWDNGRGIDSGRAIGSAQTDAMQGHNHSLKVAGWQAAGGSLYPGIGGYGHNSLYYTFNSGTPFGMISDGTNGTPRISNETRARNIALMFCIKY